MTKKREHRVIVEITFSEPVLEKEATFLVKRIMSSCYSDLGLYGRTCKVKSFSHVFTSLHIKTHMGHL